MTAVLCVTKVARGATLMAKRTFAPGPPMDLANMRRQGVHRLIAYCLNDSCRHQGLIDVSSYPRDTPFPWFRSKVKCAKSGARGNRIDVRPNWKERAGHGGEAAFRLRMIHGSTPLRSTISTEAMGTERSICWVLF
jgi:hypothetical protein